MLTPASFYRDEIRAGYRAPYLAALAADVAVGGLAMGLEVTAGWHEGAPALALTGRDPRSRRRGTTAGGRSR